ncbi:hypothetical protein HPB51_020264 [Rhipicephalus microplus]|uniref:Uncharacterized protein n=1 Tax=Rhipicephalus microplus TaxID=6941 RepID=A0A9J6EUV8_RHIMP|nr:hypothetical protein HPB51_020264 [Rhipicephalus microplus]
MGRNPFLFGFPLCDRCACNTSESLTVDVNCTGRGLEELPLNLPLRARVLRLANNSIKSLMLPSKGMGGAHHVHHASVLPLKIQDALMPQPANISPLGLFLPCGVLQFRRERATILPCRSTSKSLPLQEASHDIKCESIYARCLTLPGVDTKLHCVAGIGVGEDPQLVSPLDNLVAKILSYSRTAFGFHHSFVDGNVTVWLEMERRYIIDVPK